MMKRDEDIAGSVLARVHRSNVEPRDIPGAPPGTHDLDIVGDRLVAVEVTSTVDVPVREMWSNILKNNWEFQALAGVWAVSVREPILVDALHRRVVRCLAVLERFGVESFDRKSPPHSDPDVATAVADLREVGVRGATRVGQQKPGLVVLSTSTGRSLGGDALPSAVEDVLARSDNIDKLTRAQADERHLWIWVSGEPAISAMSFDLPDLAPKLPSPIDVVWAAQGLLAGEDEDQPLRLWRLDATGWSDLTAKMRAACAKR